jgi:hypothetical protein
VLRRARRNWVWEVALIIAGLAALLWFKIKAL